MYDVMIVGGGPAGLSAALVLARARHKVIVFDDNQPRNARAQHVNGFLGHDGIAPAALRDLGRRQADAYGVEFVDERVREVRHLIPRSQADPPFFVCTVSGREASGRKLLLASGMCDVLPDIPGAVECYGKSVHHCPYCDGWEHRDQRLLAIAAKYHSAIELGLSLKAWSTSVTVLANGVPVSAVNRHDLKRHHVKLCDEAVMELIHSAGQLTGVRFASGDRCEGDALFFGNPQHQQCDLARSLGCEPKHGELLKSSSRQQTNVPGLFLAGDVDGDVQFAIVAAAEGAKAAVAIHQELASEDRAAASHRNARAE